MIATTVTSRCNDCFGSQQNCPYTKSSLLRGAMQSECSVHQLHCPDIKDVLTLSAVKKRTYCNTKCNIANAGWLETVDCLVRT